MIPRRAALNGNISRGEFKLDSGNGTSTPKETRHAKSLFDNHGSYVLLAACSRDGLAFESGNRGLFTQALIAKLRENEADDSEMTYVDLIQFLPTIPGLRISLISRPPRLYSIRRVLDLSQTDTDTTLRGAAQEPLSVQHAGTTKDVTSCQERRYAGPYADGR